MRAEKLSRIESLRQELLALGYYRFQVDDMVEEALDGTNLHACPESALDDVHAALEEHLQFARLTKELPGPRPLARCGLPGARPGGGQDKTGEAELVALGAQEGGWYNGVGGEGHGE